MSFLTGTHALANGADSGSVVFSPAFAGVPPLVIPVVQNISDPLDPTILLLNASAFSVTATGFDFELDGTTNTANYVLQWMAGTPDMLFAAVTAVGRRLTELPKFTGTPADHDVWPMARVSPVPQSVGITWATLKNYFVRKLPGVPAAPTVTAGDLLSMAVDSSYLYVRFSTGTARIPLHTTNWAISDASVKQVRGLHTCTTDQVQTITFPGGANFGTPPTIRSAVIINTVAGAKQMLYGMVTAVTNTGFEFTLNSAPGAAGEANNYYLSYAADL